PGRGQNMPADHLFRSLAATQKSRAIAVILSGGGTDGTLGFQALKAEAGITFAQDPASARQPSMPRSAAVDGNVDYILAPQEIAPQLLLLRHPPYNTDPATARDPLAERADVLTEILALLRGTNGVDFTHYKRSTIKRRVQRRMALRNLDSVTQYLR